MELRLASGITNSGTTQGAAWLRERLINSPRGQTLVSSVIPAGFERYARILHPAMRYNNQTQREETVRWADIAKVLGKKVHSEMQWDAVTRAPHVPDVWHTEPVVGHLPVEIRRVLIEILRQHTSNSQNCWICLWEGFAGVSDALEGYTRVELPHRTYFLLRSTLAALGQPIFQDQWAYDIGPTLWWPENQAWCVSTEIDFRWSYVGGSKELIGAILADTRIESLPADPNDRGDAFADKINFGTNYI